MSYQVQVDSEAKYHTKSYISPKRWSSYAIQVREAMNINPEKILEIGPGNLLVTDILKKMNYHVETLDIDKRTQADHVGSITDENFVKKLKYKFDLVIACQILEHIKYEDSLKALTLMKRVAKSAIVSLPHSQINGKFFYFLIKLPGVRDITLAHKWFTRKTHYQFNGEHYWELGTEGYNINKVTRDIKGLGWKIRKQFFNPDNPYHYFFVLENHENQP